MRSKNCFRRSFKSKKFIFKLTIMLSFIFFIALSFQFSSNTIAKTVTNAYDDECGYKGCPKISPDKLNVHIICHTHDDVGWVKTPDEYFFGGNRNTNYFAVEQILDSVVSELMKNKHRRFVYVESAFLWRWWKLKDDNVREEFKKLVEQGRLQLLGGGWVMSDEATTHYSALIDQMTLGLKFLKDTFGECNLPKVAWQLDPFGHSGEVAMEFAEMGFDGLFFSRMDYKEYSARIEQKALEMIWRPDTREGPEAELFTGQTYDPMNPYHPPKGLCFDITCKDEPVIDDKSFHGYNIEKRANDFVVTSKKYASVYKTKNVMLTMGGDFHYMVASSWFNNLDRLIKYINQNRTDINVIYSTPACYLKAVHSANTSWPAKINEDFFPYGGTFTEIWTGYYTSRPNFKAYAYKANNFLQIVKQLRISLGNQFEKEEFELASAVATAQHHDAMSGTEKQFVEDDYKTYLHEGIMASEKIIMKAFSKWQGNLDYNLCPFLYMSNCATSEMDTKFIITIYNPHAHYKNFTTRIPVNMKNYIIVDEKENKVPFDLLSLPIGLKQMKYRKVFAKEPHELVFSANDLPPLGVKSYLIETTGSPTLKRSPEKFLNIGNDPKATFLIEFGEYKLRFNETTGLLNEINYKYETWKFEQNFYFYSSYSSGAYLFYSDDDAKVITPRVEKISTVRGNNTIEIRQIFNDYISQNIRLYKNVDHIEFDWIIGEMPKPMQIITRYDTKILNGRFYTDANGRRLIKRETKDKVAESYYPITSAAVLMDDVNRLTVLTDRPQGAASWFQGSIEIMLHRSMSYDDNKGVEEILRERKEGAVIRGTHIIQLSRQPASDNMKSHSDGAKRHRIGAKEIAMAPVIAFSRANDIQWSNIKNGHNVKSLKPTLPENVHLLTYEKWSNYSVLVRLEHIFEIGEDPILSKKVTVNLKNIFPEFNISEVVELTLSATHEKRSVKRLKWIRENVKQNETKVEPIPESLEITLNPMQIRTFEIKMISPSSGEIIQPHFYLFAVVISYSSINLFLL